MNPKRTLSPIARTLLIALAPAIGLGLARFAYALILPDMKVELNWTYSAAGWMNTINAVGYLAGSLLAFPLSRHISPWRLLMAGVWLTVAGILITGVTSEFSLLSVCRFITGFGGAIIFVVGGAICASIASAVDGKSDRIVSIFYAGVGFGIVLPGLLLPTLLAKLGSSGWPVAWMLLGGIAVALGFAIMFAKPKDLPQNKSLRQNNSILRFFNNYFPILLGYAAFGVGTIGYMTFMFALLKRLGATTYELSTFWTTIGAAAMISPWIWTAAIHKYRHGYSVAMLILISLIGAGAPLLSQSMPIAIFSAGIFGTAIFSTAAATTAFVRRNVSAANWTFAIGIFTCAFSLGQITGPIMVGFISDQTGNLKDGLIWSCMFLLAGAIISSLQRDLHQLAPTIQSGKRENATNRNA